MKIKIILLIFTLHFSITIKAQINNKIEVIYKKKIVSRTFEDDNNDINNTLNNINNKIINIAKELNFQLIIDKNISEFKLKSNSLLADDYMYSLAVSHGGGSGFFFNDTRLKEAYIRKEIGGEYFLIKKDNVNWKLSNETKKIGKYACFKATTTMTVNNYNKTKKKIKAWYCPSLPFSFGPIGYYLLPGLILQLEIEDTAIFTMKSIAFNKNNITLKKPNLKKYITTLEYYEISKEVYENK